MRLLRAARDGNSEQVARLLEAGADVNYQDHPNRQSALFLACAAGHLDVVRGLLARQADPNIRTIRESTPLMLAAASGYDEILTALIDAGADVYMVNSCGVDALYWATLNGHASSVALLIRARAHTNRPCLAGLYELAVRNQHVDCAATIFGAIGPAVAEVEYVC